MKWIILEAFCDTEGAVIEWEAAGTVMGRSRVDALEAARGWPDLRRPLRLEAVPWSSADSGLREDAGAEDQARRAFRSLAEPPIHAVLMMGATTAVLADYPELERSLAASLGRPLEPEAASRVFLLYVTVLFDSFCRVTRDVLGDDASHRLRPVLRSEFAGLLSVPLEGESVPPDELAEIMEPILEYLEAEEPPTDAYARHASAAMAELVGKRYDPNTVGPVAVQLQATLLRLRIAEVVKSRETSSGRGA